MRQSIREEIASITPGDDLEASDIANSLRWIDSGAGLFRIAKPATPSKHLISYFVLVDEDHVLLVDHKNAQLWLPTGGHVDPDEHPRTTVLRELYEELAVRIEAVAAPIMLSCTTTVGLTAGHEDVSLWYAIRVSRDTPLQPDYAEFAAVRWFAFADIPYERTDPQMRRFIAKLRGASA